jgi:hypothetical protein
MVPRGYHCDSGRKPGLSDIRKLTTQMDSGRPGLSLTSTLPQWTGHRGDTFHCGPKPQSALTQRLLAAPTPLPEPPSSPVPAKLLEQLVSLTQSMSLGGSQPHEGPKAFPQGANLQGQH